MDLNNNKITLGELLKNEKANRILRIEFKEYFDSPLMLFAKKMSLQSLLELADGRISSEKINRILNELKNI